MSDDKAVSGDIVSSEVAIMAHVKGEIDVQIATARAYPRSLSKFLEDAMSMVSMDIATAEACSYAVPRGGDTIQGPSVRLAEIIASAFGNLRTASRIISIDEKHVTCQGACHDLERNVASSVEVKRRITTRNGKRFNDDMIVVTANAGSAIGFRNAVFKVIPKALWQPVYDKALELARGKEQTLPDRRNAALQFLEDKGVTKEQILAVLDVRKLEDIDLDKLSVLRGIITAAKDGDTTFEQAFAIKAPPAAGLYAGRQTVPLNKTEPTPEASADKREDNKLGG